MFFKKDNSIAFADGCVIQLLPDKSIVIKDQDESLAFDEKDKPEFSSDTGEIVLEYSGLASDHNEARSWARAHYQEGGYSPSHYHQERTEIYYIRKGEAKVIIDENEYQLKKGDCIQILPGQEHQVFNVSAQGELELIVKCTPAWIIGDFCVAQDSTSKQNKAGGFGNKA